MRGLRPWRDGDWGNPEFVVRGIGELQGQMEPDDNAYIFVEPSSVEVSQVEEMCNEAGDKFIIMLNPKLEDVATIGIGYAGRQLRERFLSTLETVYYLRPMDGAILFRCYPSPLAGVAGNRRRRLSLLGRTAPARPWGEGGALDRILMGWGNSPPTAAPRKQDSPPPAKPKRGGFLSELQSFIRALSQ